MDSWLSFVIFFTCLFVITAYKYRLPCLISNIFLTVGCCSVFCIFLLAGLTLKKSTVFGTLALLFFSISNSLNLFSWIKKYFKTNNYTARMAMYLAIKKHNIYLYELALMLLIPSALLIFLLPTSLKEMGIVLALGSLFILTIWFIFSNFYLPKLSYLGEKREYLLFSKGISTSEKERPTLGYSQFVWELRANNRQANFKEEIKKHKARLAPFDFAPLIFLIGIVGFSLLLSNYELNYPNFFKNNKLLSLDGNAKNQISGSLKGFNGSYKELKSIPASLKKTAVTSPDWIYYLFPESLNIQALIDILSGNNKGTAIKNNGSHNWTIQNTDAFSIMPSLEKSLNLLFLSLIPLSCYNIFRFGLSNALSLTFASALFLGASFLFLLSGSLPVPELFPELILSTFFILLSFWVQAILNSKTESKVLPEEKKNKRFIFKYQSWGIKAELKKENEFYFLSFLIISILAFALKNSNELVYAFAFLSFLVFGICLFFIPTLTSLWANLNLLVDKYYFHLVNFFVKEKKRLKQIVTEEENVLGINY